MKRVNFLYLSLVCAITYALIFVGIPFFLHQTGMFDSFGGLIAFIAFVFFWGIVFLFFGIQRVLLKRIPDSEQSVAKKSGINLIALITALLVFFFLYRLIDGL